MNSKIRNVEIDSKAWDDALKRHEEAWGIELDSVDIRAVVLKTKKAVLEQARSNLRCENATIDFKGRIESMNRMVNSFQEKIDELELALERSNASFTAAVKLLSKEPQNKKGFFKGFWEFIKCLMK